MFYYADEKNINLSDSTQRDRWKRETTSPLINLISWPMNMFDERFEGYTANWKQKWKIISSLSLSLYSPMHLGLPK